MESRAVHTHPKNTQGPPPSPSGKTPLPFPSPFDCCLLHQLFSKMVESFQFYYTFVLTTYMALGCQYISSVPTAITDHNMTQGSQDIPWGHTWSTDPFFVWPVCSLQGVKKEEDLRLPTGQGHGENWQFRLNLTLFSTAMIFIGTREY